MSTPEEKAEVVLIVIQRIFKWLAFATLGVAILIGGVVGGVAGYEYVTVGRHVSRVVATIDPKVLCEEKKSLPGRGRNLLASMAYRVGIRVKNGSSKRISGLSIQFQARLRGRSTNWAEYGFRRLDYIIEPGKTGIWCISSTLLKTNAPKKNPADYVWRVFASSIEIYD
jgi:hypothetical protein